MLTQNQKAPKTQNWFKKLAVGMGITGITVSIGIPVLAQIYPPYALFQPSAYRNYPYRNSEKSIGDTLAENSQFGNLTHELKKAGLLEKLKQGGSYTILAPTDSAFNSLPKATYERFSQPGKRLKVLNYHLIPGEVSQTDLNSKKIRTLEGNLIKIAADSNGRIKINGATGKPPSIQAKNGVIVEIDRVLLPPGFEK
jgi:uncharacterized surface protein with fasciclin (FAS1) repeats